MKRIALTAFCLLYALLAGAQSPEDALRDAYGKFQASDSLLLRQQAANRLARIAGKWPDAWLGHYYTAYAQIALSYQEADVAKRDLLLDQAEASLAKATDLQPAEKDELFVLRAYLAAARLAVNPQERWQQYGAAFDENLARAAALRKDNPRIHYLKGHSLYFTPKAYGGGPQKALPHFEKAAALFNRQPEGDIAKPDWGKKENGHWLEQCRTATSR